MRKSLNYLFLGFVGIIGLGLTSCQEEDLIGNTQNSNADIASFTDEINQVVAQSITLTAPNNFSVYDFGYGTCNVSMNGNTIAISDFKADCTIGPFTITPSSSSEPWCLTYSNDDGIMAVNEYNESVAANHLLGGGTINYGSKTFYLHISKSFFKSGILSVCYKNLPSVKSELVFNRF